MCKIRIKNFGPIKEGYLENEGWMDIKKVTVFIGNQGSGKSTVAKLISVFMWLEKSIIRGDLPEDLNSYKGLDEILRFHRIENYFQENTQVSFEGRAYMFTMVKKLTEFAPKFKVDKIEFAENLLPKIMYVPAERNFLSAISNISKISDFIVGSLKDYSIEFRNAQLAYKDKEINLPINNTSVYYDAKDDENYIGFGGKKLKLTEASSGFHSIVPLFWVSKYLVDFLKLGEKRLLELLSPDQTVRRRNELNELNKEFISEDVLKEKEKQINAKYICNHFVNIVEEPEQNLFPTSQKSMLESLLTFNNESENNRLIITTHSPYLINYLTLAVKADMVEENLNNEKISLKKLAEIVPVEATIAGTDLAIYELSESDGLIKMLPDYKGLPSDENYLNSSLEDSNELFAQLQEIEKGWR